jgi:Protein of unknown function (DUF3365)
MLAALWWMACAGSPPAPQPEPAPPAAEAADPRLAKAEGAIGALASRLRSRLQAVLTESGPVAAAEVCSVEAQALAAQVAQETGVRVGRSSLRLRNPANAAPPWVAEWLTAQGERPVAGFSRLDGDVARVLKPLTVEAPCLTCHGPAEGIPAEVKALLASRYPADAAVGYAVGDLRGAVWAELGP